MELIRFYERQSSSERSIDFKISLRSVRPLFNPKYSLKTEGIDFRDHRHTWEGRRGFALDSRIFSFDKTEVHVAANTHHEFLSNLKAHHSSPLIDELEKPLSFMNAYDKIWTTASDDTGDEVSWATFLKALRWEWLAVQAQWPPVAGYEDLDLVEGEDVGGCHG
ncbi:hypothetical protein BKA67DRAFT_652515 [Truncatella angustata]|uniref:Uncharacterized protein n=1 Tax=Truncatella angustata TaxID=152316 RepID=A0A9P8UW53_9PEZI|nr:uncharacterized protein BKA67DRAFT_652515 [Truncatella angustata]KAH6659273.1 hypothetical protein BKA67DRAFT_652515 [Truncatella angustata]